MKDIIEEIWSNRELLKDSKYIKIINDVISELDLGKIRVAEKKDGKWVVNEWIKKAVILFFPISKMETIKVGPFEFHDKIASKKLCRNGCKSCSSCYFKIWIFY